MRIESRSIMADLVLEVLQIIDIKLYAQIIGYVKSLT